MKHPLLVPAAPLLGALLLAGAGLAAALQDKVTYDDTPLLPGTNFHVHGERPRPPVVTPGTAGAPPSDAIVLFDGTDLSQWKGPEWKVENGYVEVSGGGKISTERKFGDIQLHLEFATPAEVKGNSQGRGNSGVFLMDRYEIQVLDSFENDTYPDGQCGAMYGQYPPAVNASRRPGEWQTYDIVFHAPRFDGDEVAEPARVTVFHNGVLLHHDRAFLGGTTHRALPKYARHGATEPLSLQDHGNPMRFRNIWVREL